jgi:putative endonuclease
MEPSTSPGVPWQLLWYTEKESRSSAQVLESKLKNLSRARLLKLMQKYSGGIADEAAAARIKSLLEGG